MPTSNEVRVFFKHHGKSFANCRPRSGGYFTPLIGVPEIKNGAQRRRIELIEIKEMPKPAGF
jgi:hypothetical protein